MKGVEVEGLIRLTDWLEIGGNGAYTAASYTDPIATVGTQSLKFGPYADTPLLSATVYAQITLPVGDLGDGSFRVDAYPNRHFLYSQLDGPNETAKNS